MIIEPKVRDFICTTAHPDGCAEHVRRQVATTKSLGKAAGPAKVLVIGASTGYGFGTRIAAAFGCGAATLGIMFEKPATDKRTATPGWYNTAEFERLAKADGLYAKSINGDAFSAAIKEQTIQTIKDDLGQVDMVIYSLAAPRRTMADGTTYSSALKTVGEPFVNKSLDMRSRKVIQAQIPPASEDEITGTVKVMGGEDWKDWIDALQKAGVLAKNAVTLAYSYIGPELTYPVYHNGTIGMAKRHLFATAKELSDQYAAQGLRAYISVNKALVTQASAAIPVVPLYIAILYRVMKDQGLHEGCVEQMNRLLREKLTATPETDAEGRIRLDDYEMRPAIQAEVMSRWERICDENLEALTDIEGYWEDFYHMFGFHFDNVDYSRDIQLV